MQLPCLSAHIHLICAGSRRVLRLEIHTFRVTSGLRRDEDMILSQAECWLEPPGKWAFRPLFFVFVHEIRTRVPERGWWGGTRGMR